MNTLGHRQRVRLKTQSKPAMPGHVSQIETATHLAQACDGWMADETYNPWTVVNVVFHHLVKQGLHPTLGESGHPGEPAAELLRALGIEPRAEGDIRMAQNIRDHLAELRASMFEDQ
jgi:hypothetical protein